MICMQKSHHNAVDSRNAVHAKHEGQRILVAAFVQYRNDDSHKVCRTNIIAKGKQRIGFGFTDFIIVIQLAHDLGTHGKAAEKPHKDCIQPEAAVLVYLFQNTAEHTAKL